MNHIASAELGGRYDSSEFAEVPLSRKRSSAPTRSHECIRRSAASRADDHVHPDITRERTWHSLDLKEDAPQTSGSVISNYRLSERTNWDKFGSGSSPASSFSWPGGQLEPWPCQPTECLIQQDNYGLKSAQYGHPVHLSSLQGHTELKFQLVDERPESSTADIYEIQMHIKECPGSSSQLVIPKNKGRRQGSQRDTSEERVPSKNLISERKRRRKLNDSLLTLRSLVPIITKMDRASILADAIFHLQDLKKQVEMLENQQKGYEEGHLKTDSREVVDHSCSSLELSEVENGRDLNLGYLMDGSGATSLNGENVFRDPDIPAVLDEEIKEIQLAVVKIEDEIYKLSITCSQQVNVILQLSKAIEAFVIEIVYSNISAVINSTGAICIFIVRICSWNDMTIKDVRADFEKQVGSFGLRILQSESCD